MIALAGLLTLACAASAQGRPPIGAYTTRGAYSFVSAPGLNPPKLLLSARPKFSALAPGYFFTANFPNLGAGVPLVGEGGPLILDRHLQPVWFRSVGTGVVASDLKLQSYDGKPALSWWQGVINRLGVATSGTVEVVDQHYRKLASLTGKAGWVISPHEVVISGHDAWVTAYKDVRHVNLLAFKGPAHGTLYDAAVQEYDLTNGELKMTWDAFNPGGSPHIPLSASEQRPERSASAAWDAYHLNSIQLVGPTQFLVSMRNTWAAYLVDISTGKVLWTLGGKHSTFKVPGAAHFEWQHQVELIGANTVSMFDDHCCELRGGALQPPTGSARGLVLKLNFARHTVALVHQYLHHPSLDTAFTGSTEVLGNGNVAVGWGSQPYLSEYSKSGKQLLDARWPGPDQSYRALVEPWVGAPLTPPSGAVRRRGSKTTVSASWNGSTEVAKWVLLGGTSTTRLKVVARAARSGFETAIALTKSYKVYELQALDSTGRVLGSSNAFPRSVAAGRGFY